MTEAVGLSVARGVLPLNLPSHLLESDEMTELLSNVPVHLLHAELQRRQDAPEKPTCGRVGKAGGYNTAAHVFALFLIFFLSTLGMHLFRVRWDIADIYSMLVSGHSAPLPEPADTSPIPLPIPPLRHRSADCHGIHPSLTDRIRVPDRPMSARLLEQGLSTDGGSDSHAVSLHGGLHRDVLCYARRET